MKETRSWSNNPLSVLNEYNTKYQIKTYDRDKTTVKHRTNAC